jgi:hypothetical protein
VVTDNEVAKVWSFDTCNVEFGSMTSHTTNDHPMVVSTTRYTLPLGVLTGGSVELHFNDMNNGANTIYGEKASYWLYLTSKSKEISLYLSSEMSGRGTLVPPTSESVSVLNLRFRDEAIAQRVLDAFKHAADLCRGKEPF